MFTNCAICGTEYDKTTRAHKSGRITVCEDCADEAPDVQLYTGNVIFSHKCGGTLQINSDPALTSYINNATKLKNKGSNMGANAIACSKMSNRTVGACLKTADAYSYKNREE